MLHPHSLGLHLAIAAATSLGMDANHASGITLAIIAVANAIAAIAVASERIHSRKRTTRRSGSHPIDAASKTGNRAECPNPPPPRRKPHTKSQHLR